MTRRTSPTIWSVVASVGLYLAPGAAGNASADTVSYYLNQSNEDAVLPDGTNYLQVTISDVGSGDIKFDVTILQPLLDIANSSDFGLDSFGFNATGAASAVTESNFAALPADWDVLTNKNQDGFGRFELVADGNGAGERISPTLSFYIVGISGDTVYDYLVLSANNAGQGNQFFAAHVGGFSAGDATSAYFGGLTPVPIPAAVWLLGSALLCFGVIGQDRGKYAVAA